MGLSGVSAGPTNVPSGKGEYGLSPSGSRPISQPFSVEESQKTLDGIKTTTSPQRSRATEMETKPGPKESTPTSTLPAEPAKRAMTKDDMLNHLLQIRAQPSPENQQIIMSILSHGLEASGTNFEAISRAIKANQTSSSLEGSVVALTKGITDSPRAADILSNFFATNPKISQQLQKLQTSVSQLSQIIQTSQQLFSKGLLTGLYGILADTENHLRRLNQKSNDRDVALAALKRGGFISDMKSLHDLMGGLSRQLAAQENTSPFAGPVREQLQSLQGELANLLNNVTAQLLLSKNTTAQVAVSDKFAYWQLPNPLTQMPRDIEILIKKDPSKKKNSINPRKTKMIVKFSTPDLGEIIVILEIQEQKLWCTFQADSFSTREGISKLFPAFRKTVEAYNYEIVGVKTTSRKIDFKKLLVPVFSLDNLSRIRTEA